MSVLTNNTQSSPGNFLFCTSSAPVILSPVNVVNSGSNTTMEITTTPVAGTIGFNTYPSETPYTSIEFDQNAVRTIINTVSYLNVGNANTVTANVPFRAYNSNTGNYLTMTDSTIQFNGDTNIEFGDTDTTFFTNTQIGDANGIVVGIAQAQATSITDRGIIFSKTVGTPATITVTQGFSNTGYTSNLLVNPTQGGWTWTTALGGVAHTGSKYDPSNQATSATPYFAWISPTGAMYSPAITSYPERNTVTLTWYDSKTAVDYAGNATSYEVYLNGTRITYYSFISNSWGSNRSVTYTSTGNDELSWVNVSSAVDLSNVVCISNIVFSGLGPVSNSNIGAMVAATSGSMSIGLGTVPTNIFISDSNTTTINSQLNCSNITLTGNLQTPLLNGFPYVASLSFQSNLSWTPGSYATGFRQDTATIDLPSNTYSNAIWTVQFRLNSTTTTGTGGTFFSQIQVYNSTTSNLQYQSIFGGSGVVADQFCEFLYLAPAVRETMTIYWQYWNLVAPPTIVYGSNNTSIGVNIG